MVRKRIENVAEIRGSIKDRCKLGLSAKRIHDEICVVYGDKQMSFSAVYSWFANSVTVRNQDDLGLQLPSITKSKSIIEKDARFTVRQLAQITNLGLAPIRFILKKMLYIKIRARWNPHLLIDEQKRLQGCKWQSNC